jgi:hypothetical protein
MLNPPAGTATTIGEDIPTPRTKELLVFPPVGKTADAAETEVGFRGAIETATGVVAVFKNPQ